MLGFATILKFNRGLSYNYILGKLERGKDAQFVDASTPLGIGGCSGYNYFMVENTELLAIFGLYQKESESQKELMDIPLPRLPIAYIELFAALVGISVFSQYQPNN